MGDEPAAAIAGTAAWSCQKLMFQYFPLISNSSKLTSVSPIAPYAWWSVNRKSDKYREIGVHALCRPKPTGYDSVSLEIKVMKIIAHIYARTGEHAS